MSRVVWSPQPKQSLFMQRPEYEALYGGAAGGGKTDALLNEALRQVHIPYYRGLIFRSTYPQLEAMISRSYELYMAAFNASYNKSEKAWTFPSGAHIFFGYMQREDDKYNYQGKPYDFIGFDELTHFTYTQYMYLMSRNRPVGPGTRVYMRATANPGGKGHVWVKDRFITPAPPMTTIKSSYEIVDPDGKKITLSKSRIFVPSTVFDNQALLNNDPNYIASLAMLPEAERKALLYGDWDSFEGQVFTEWRNDPLHYDDHKYTHVINPFEVPDHWKILRCFDFGYARPFAVYWLAYNQDGKMYVIREYYGCTGTPNTGVKMEPVEIARHIREIEREDSNLCNKKISGVADPSIFDESRGESIAQMMSRSPNFVYWAPGDNARIAGKMQYHYRFAFDQSGNCGLQIFNTCKNFIRTIPSLVYDEKNVEDIDTDTEDHIYDAVRYALMEHPIAPPKRTKRAVVEDDPLDMYKDYYKQ